MSLSRCFKSVDHSPHILSSNGRRIIQWVAENHAPQEFNDPQTDAMARLLPLLMCGEQSAQLVFNHEIEQQNLSNDSALIRCLQEVEADEHRHDLALSTVAVQLAQIDEFKQIQRQARRFYMGLARVEQPSDHFVRIATLDTCVTQIMDAFERSKLGKNHAFSILCGLIKKDEAKHVYVSRHYAIALGAKKEAFKQEQQLVCDNLFRLLHSQHGAFETMGICLDDLQQHLMGKFR